MGFEAFANRGVEFSAQVDADSSVTGPNRAFKLASGQMTIATAQGEVIDGILLDDPVALSHGRFAVSGIVPCLLGNTVSESDKLTTGTDGRLELAATGDEIIGKALEAGVVGDIISVALNVVSGAVLV